MRANTAHNFGGSHSLLIHCGGTHPTHKQTLRNQIWIRSQSKTFALLCLIFQFLSQFTDGNIQFAICRMQRLRQLQRIITSRPLLSNDASRRVMRSVQNKLLTSSLDSL